MKKCILFVIILFFVFVLFACSKNDDSVLYTGSYVMELNQEQNDNEKIAPVITIDTEKKQFIFSYDMLSSYLTIGTYEINNNVFTATTSDEKYHYVFNIVDENTLSFIEEQSSKISVFDTRFSVVPQNSAIFKKIEK